MEIAKRIFIDALECKEFKKFDSVKLFNLGKEVYIVGRNTEGKSSILDSITWTLMGLDTFGNRMDPIKSGANMTWVKLDLDIDWDPMSIRKIINLKKNGKTETTSNFAIELDKELFYSISNPRYLQGLDPKNIKAIISKVVKIPTSIMELSIDPKLVDVVKDLDGTNSIKKITQVENELTNINAKIKEIEKNILKENGKIEGCVAVKGLLDENEIVIANEVDTVMNITIDKALLSIANYESEIVEQKQLKNKYDEYRTSAYECLAKEFNLTMKNTQIKLLENGKEVFIITYNGKNIKSCSNSEQLLAGLEIVNSISGLTGYSYPCLVDNAECILNIDTKQFPNIKQFFFSIVADEELSTWEDGELTNIETRQITPRTLEALRPTVKILDGWGSKTKEK